MKTWEWFNRCCVNHSGGDGGVKNPFLCSEVDLYECFSRHVVKKKTALKIGESLQCVRHIRMLTLLYRKVVFLRVCLTNLVEHILILTN